MIRPITDTLRHIGGGVFVDTASDKLAERSSCAARSRRRSVRTNGGLDDDV